MENNIDLKFVEPVPKLWEVKTFYEWYKERYTLEFIEYLQIKEL